MPKLTVILASTRPGRAGERIADWFTRRARGHGAFDVELVDLAELDLPFVDEPNHPRLRRYTKQHTKDWSARVDAADAFVFVMPEYNHGFTAPLKNALDFLHAEWRHKPVGVVSYGGVAAGTRAVQQLKPVLVALRMLPVMEAVNIPFHTQFIDEDGRLAPNETMELAADAMLDELLASEEALRDRRAAVRDAEAAKA
jgi:NAD(P)H-dependent FMN reductase